MNVFFSITCFLASIQCFAQWVKFNDSNPIASQISLDGDSLTILAGTNPAGIIKERVVLQSDFTIHYGLSELQSLRFAGAYSKNRKTFSLRFYRFGITEFNTRALDTSVAFSSGFSSFGIRLRYQEDHLGPKVQRVFNIDAGVWMKPHRLLLIETRLNGILQPVMGREVQKPVSVVQSLYFLVSRQCILNVEWNKTIYSPASIVFNMLYKPRDSLIFEGGVMLLSQSFKTGIGFKKSRYTFFYHYFQHFLLGGSHQWNVRYGLF